MAFAQSTGTGPRSGGTYGESAPSEQPYSPSSWELAFVQDCNLRCGYCSTGWGRFGQGAAVMQPNVWKRLAELILRMSDGQPRVHIGFATGETFLFFDEAMAFLDHLRGLAAAKQIELDVQIITNGTLVTEGHLQICLEKKIALCFSIDGPSTKHDRFRKSADGAPTHRRALENWRRYRNMVRSVPNGPGCDIYSVLAGNSRLRDVARYWRRLGAKRFKALPAEPNKTLCRIDSCGWQSRRDHFLSDIAALAFSESTRLRGRPLTQEAVVPAALMDIWRRLDRGEPYSPCGAGYQTISVDAAGCLFPCQNFVGFPDRGIGDVRSGVDAARLAAFRAARSLAASRCHGCWARFLCADGCCASDPKSGVVLDAWGECAFFQSFAEIGIRTYQDWRDHQGLPGRTAAL